MLDQTPATDYVWILVVYDSNRPKSQCQCKKVLIVFDETRLLVAKNLTELAAEFFYERVMIGTLDMAFPSNRETFQPIVTEGSVQKAIFDFDLLFLILRKKFQV